MRLIAAFESDIDRFLNIWVTSTSASVAGALGGLAATGITIYYMFLAYAIARGEIQEPMSKLTKEVFSMALIAVFATSVGVYQEQVVGAVNALLGLLTSAVTQSDAKTVGETIDLLWTTDVTLADSGKKVPMHMALWVIAQEHPLPLGIPDVTYFIAEFLTFIGMVILCVCCLLPAVLAKIGLSLMLGIGPLFIMLAIIPYTRNYFASWLANMLGNLMTLVLVSAICAATTNMFKGAMQSQLSNISYEASNPIALGLALLVIGAALGFASLHVSQIGAQLAGGGMALDTKGLAGAVVQGLMSKQPKPDSTGSPQANNSVGSSTSYSAGKRLGQFFSNKKG